MLTKSAQSLLLNINPISIFSQQISFTYLRNLSSLPLSWHLTWVLRAMESVGQSWLLAHKEAAVNLFSALPQ